MRGTQDGGAPGSGAVGGRQLTYGRPTSTPKRPCARAGRVERPCGLLAASRGLSRCCGLCTAASPRITQQRSRVNTRAGRISRMARRDYHATMACCDANSFWMQRRASGRSFRKMHVCAGSSGGPGLESPSHTPACLLLACRQAQRTPTENTHGCNCTGAGAYAGGCGGTLPWRRSLGGRALLHRTPLASRSRRGLPRRRGTRGRPRVPVQQQRQPCTWRGLAAPRKTAGSSAAASTASCGPPAARLCWQAKCAAALQPAAVGEHVLEQVEPPRSEGALGKRELQQWLPCLPEGRRHERQQAARARGHRAATHVPRGTGTSPCTPCPPRVSSRAALARPGSCVSPPRELLHDTRLGYLACTGRTQHKSHRRVS